MNITSHPIQSTLHISEGVIYTAKGPLLRFASDILAAVFLLELGYKLVTGRHHGHIAIKTINPANN